MDSGGSAIRGLIGRDGGCRGESGLRRCRDDSTPVFLALCVLYVTFALGCGYDLHDSTSDFGFDIHIVGTLCFGITTCLHECAIHRYGIRYTNI